ncbi:MAG: EAL domain-containing protein, partial [Calditerrivibrio sp.]|nr:EAL domain-containing protein [Calditerrivibrio sp.]
LLMNATKEDRYILYYQPYYYCNNMELAGVEALIRLKDYQNNILTPNRFIDYLENSIYLEEFEQWLIKKAISFIEKYRINISINISAKLINKTIINPSFLSIPIDIGRYLTIEITEREINNAIENYNDEIRSIKLKTGVNISIDDFGTGYSSLSRMKDLPADIVKIDMSFVRDMEKSEKNKDFVAAIIDLSRRFHFKTVAEGVESSAQLKILQQLGCDMVQGYLFSKPVPEEKLTFYRQ